MVKLKSEQARTQPDATLWIEAHLGRSHCCRGSLFPHRISKMFPRPVREPPVAIPGPVTGNPGAQTAIPDRARGGVSRPYLLAATKRLALNSRSSGSSAMGQQALTSIAPSSGRTTSTWWAVVVEANLLWISLPGVGVDEDFDFGGRFSGLECVRAVIHPRPR